jgi:signal transduction histidine kinase
MSLRFSEYLNKGLVIVLLLMFASTLGASVYFSYTMLSLNSLVQEGGNDVRAAFLLEDLLLNLRSAESGQRGYIITDNTGYLRPYNMAVKKIPVDLKSISEQSSLSDERAQITELTTLTHQKLAELDETLKARQSIGFDAASAIVNTNKGALLMGTIEQKVQEIGKSAFSSIGPKQLASKANLKRSLIVAVILDVFVFALCAFILRYFHQTIQRERATEGAKNEFLSLASHQLRTPATSVKQYLGMVNAGYFGKLTSEQKEALDIAYQSNESEIVIINNLLNIAKLNLEKIQITKKPVVVAKLVQSVADEYEPQIKSAKQTLVFRNKLGQQKALLDATYFKTVVENLVDNATKYSPDGAKITIDLRPAPVQKFAKKPLPSFELSIRDNGVGIGKHDLGKLFKKFSRVPSPATESVDGSGLGLYWVKQIVERHDGHIGVTSRENKGTKFTIVVPLRTEVKVPRRE